MSIDYHIHTLLCNHAKEGMDKYIKKAISLNLKEICFLDHLTFSDSGKALSMNTKEVPMYFYAVKYFADKYKKKIKIKAGLEIDFNIKHVNLIEKIVNTYNFDVIGSSVHFLDGINIVSRKYAKSACKFDVDTLYYKYYHQLEKMLSFDYFDLICHFDVVKKFNQYPSISFKKQINNILEKVALKNIALEVNTSGIHHPVSSIYPDIEIIKECKKKKIWLCIGSDAHHPKIVGQNFDLAKKLIQSAGYSHICGFKNRKKYKIPII